MMKIKALLTLMMCIFFSFVVYAQESTTFGNPTCHSYFVKTGPNEPHYVSFDVPQEAFKVNNDRKVAVSIGITNAKYQNIAVPFYLKVDNYAPADGAKPTDIEWSFIHGATFMFYETSDYYKEDAHISVNTYKNPNCDKDVIVRVRVCKFGLSN